MMKSLSLDDIVELVGLCTNSSHSTDKRMLAEERVEKSFRLSSRRGMN